MALSLRRLPSLRTASASVFGQIIPDGSGNHSGLKWLQRMRRTESFLRWYQFDIDRAKIPGWQTERQLRKQIRKASRLERGKSTRPKKGQGKLAMRREKEEKRAAQKAAKAAKKAA